MHVTKIPDNEAWNQSSKYKFEWDSFFRERESKMWIIIDGQVVTLGLRELFFWLGPLAIQRIKVNPLVLGVVVTLIHLFILHQLGIRFLLRVAGLNFRGAKYQIFHIYRVSCKNKSSYLLLYKNKWWHLPMFIHVEIFYP